MRLLHDPVRLLLTIPALLWALSFHEFCHGFAAKMVGDPTAEMRGRLSLNPFAHFDLVGTLMLLLVGFGWAKPVPINTRYFRHPRRDLVIVSLAGVAGNILTAVLTVLFFRFFGARWYNMTGRAGLIFLFQMVNINMGLAAFNLIPIPPLDGSRVLEAFLPYKYMHYYYWLERYGMIIILLLVLPIGLYLRILNLVTFGAFRDSLLSIMLKYTSPIDIFFRPIMSFLWNFLPY